MILESEHLVLTKMPTHSIIRNINCNTIMLNSIVLNNIPKVVPITTFKQKSQAVLDQLNSQDNAMIVTQGGLPVAILLPAASSLSEPDRLELMEKNMEEIDAHLKEMWGDANKNVHYSAEEIDKLTF